MIKKTKDYDKFIFRDDNRKFSVDSTHVRRLVQSIECCNLLEYAPITVNEEMEILDGQHRLEAAKSLGLDIYYQIKKNSSPEDIVLLNINKSWSSADFLHFYCQNGKQEYIKLRDFCKKYELNVSTALSFSMNRGHSAYTRFKTGEFQFDHSVSTDLMQYCVCTIDYIKRINGQSSCQYTASAKFWKALIALCRDASFDQSKWMERLEKNIMKFGPRATEKSYLSLFQEVYNWRNQQRVDLV